MTIALSSYGCSDDPQVPEGSGVPAVAIQQPPDPASGDIPLVFNVSDADADPVDIDIAFARADGVFRSASPGAGGSGVTGLSSSPDGIGHTFVWDSRTDLPDGAQDVRIRIVAWDRDGGSLPVESTPFRVDNSIDPGDNDPPIVAIDMPADTQFGIVVLAYRLSDAQSDTASIEVEYSTDGVAFAPATPGLGGDGVSELRTDPIGQVHTFVWDSPADVGGNADAVVIRVTPSDAEDTGLPVMTGPFPLRNAGFAPHGLKITEISVADNDYVELHNGTGMAIELNGHVLEWTDSVSGSGFAVLPLFTIQPDARIVLRENNGTNDAQNLFLGQNLPFADDTASSLTLRDAGGNGVDFVRWGGSNQGPPSWTDWFEPIVLAPPAGFSVLGRIAPTDSNSALDFCAMPPSPAAGNPDCLADGLSSGLVIAEVSLDDPVDALELVNTGPNPVDLTNWVVQYSAQTGGTGTILVPAHTLAPGARVVIEDDAGTPGPDVVVLPDSLPWTPGDRGSVGLLDPFANGIDFIRWGGDVSEPPAPALWTESLVLPAPQVSGVTLSRDDADSDTDDAADLCLQLATLGAPGGPCLDTFDPTSGVVINEIDAGPSDAVEVVNTGAAAVQLAMWTLAWSDTVSAPGMGYLPPYELMAGARVEIREGAGTTTPGIIYLGTDSNITWSAATGGSATLRDAYDTGIDFARWGGSMTEPPMGVGWNESMPAPSPPDGSVLGRSPDGTDTDDAVDFCIQAATPGTSNAVCQ